MTTVTDTIKKEWYNIFLLILPFVAAPFLWNHLPDQVPTHWNFQGEVNTYSSKTVELIMLPAINIIVYLLLLYIPQIDPKKRVTINQKPIPTLRMVLVFFLTGMHAWMILMGLGYNGMPSTAILPAAALLIVVLGNYMRTVQPNYFIGVRVPWTLESEENWRETHKLTSWLWVGGGILLLIMVPFIDTELYGLLFGIVIGILTVVPIAYSFYYYKQSHAS